MPFDEKLWHLPAKQGDVGGIAINAEVALRAIVEALTLLQVQTSTDLSEPISKIEKAASSLSSIFDELTGFTRAS